MIVESVTIVPVAIFAYNEERKIRTAVESALRSFDGEDGMQPLLYVLVNGSTDQTSSIVRSMALTHSNVHLVEIAFPDKCNAWNHYVYRVAPRAGVHLFMDGDMFMDPGAGPELVRTLTSSRDAVAAVSMPVGGRLAHKYRRGLIENPVIYGNLYAMKENALESFRSKGVRLPLGTIGDDGLIGFLVARDLDPRGSSIPERVIAAERSIVRSDPMPWHSLYYIRKYYRRRISVSVRYLQFQLLGPRIKARGLEAMPHHIAEIYEDMSTYRPRLRGGLNSVFDWIAWKRMASIRRRFASGELAPAPSVKE
jgi:glycosyltransferase involved in cell wall biosynthesis